ncbi:MAG TPA: hypothetical protein VE093_14820 [Polyangiaceae bacterium]|nr:hypothetical protein [Polyangiaceae bacterium]
MSTSGDVATLAPSSASSAPAAACSASLRERPVPVARLAPARTSQVNRLSWSGPSCPSTA